MENLLFVGRSNGSAEREVPLALVPEVPFTTLCLRACSGKQLLRTMKEM